MATATGPLCECGFNVPLRQQKTAPKHVETSRHKDNMAALAAEQAGETIYRCAYCPRLFIEEPKHRRHMHDEEAKLMVDCVICGSKYNENSPSAVRLHVTSSRHKDAVAALAALAPTPVSQADTPQAVEPQATNAAKKRKFALVKDSSGDESEDVKPLARKRVKHQTRKSPDDGDAGDKEEMKPRSAKGKLSRARKGKDVAKKVIMNPSFNVGTTEKLDCLFPVTSQAKDLSLPAPVLYRTKKKPTEAAAKSFARSKGLRDGILAKDFRARMHQVSVAAQVNYHLRFALHPLARQRKWLEGLRDLGDQYGYSHEEVDLLVLAEIYRHDERVLEKKTAREWRSLSAGVKGAINVFSHDDAAHQLPDVLDLEHDDLRQYAVAKTVRRSKKHPKGGRIVGGKKIKVEEGEDFDDEDDGFEEDGTGSYKLDDFIDDDGVDSDEEAVDYSTSDDEGEPSQKSAAAPGAKKPSSTTRSVSKQGKVTNGTIRAGKQNELSTAAIQPVDKSSSPVAESSAEETDESENGGNDSGIYVGGEWEVEEDEDDAADELSTDPDELIGQLPTSLHAFTKRYGSDRLYSHAMNCGARSSFAKLLSPAQMYHALQSWALGIDWEELEADFSVEVGGGGSGAARSRADEAEDGEDEAEGEQEEDEFEDNEEIIFVDAVKAEGD